MPNRFRKDRGLTRLTLVKPIVIEVSADVAWSGTSFRRPLRLHRSRPELDPSDMEIPEQLQGLFGVRAILYSRS
jgi:hypothetical protein